MDSSIETAASAPAAATPQARVVARLNRAFDLQDEGQWSAALAELESALTEARDTPDEVEFQTRVMLVLELADGYQTIGEMEKARRILAEETAFAEKLLQTMPESATLAQKRAAAGGRTQLRDRATQVGLIGEEAPEISIKTWINSEPLMLADLRGRVVLLDFWATWCTPCRAEIPELNAIQRELGPKGLTIVGPSWDDTAEGVRDFQKDIKQEYTVLIGGETVQEKFGGIPSLPTTFIIDREGRIRQKIVGESNRAGFESAIKPLLDEAPVTAKNQ